MPTTAPPPRAAAVLILLAFLAFNGNPASAETASSAESGANTASGPTTATAAALDAVVNDPNKTNAIAAVEVTAVEIDAVTVDAVTVDAEQKVGDIDYQALRHDDAWLISTRHLGCPSWKSDSNVDLQVSQYSDSGDWIESDLNSLLASEPCLTVVYVHGNRVSADDAIVRAWNAFSVLQADPAAPPMRLIIWSWPSDQIHGQIRDVRYKGARTNTEGEYLAWFLAQVDPAIPLNLIGYSYGARVVTGAMHVLGGGTLTCQGWPMLRASGDRMPINVVLMAAALHNHWLATGGYHDQCWSVLDRILVLYNSCDPVLKRYRFIEKRGRPVALGYGSAWGLDAEQAARTEQRDVCCSVGKTHSESVFFSSTEVIESVQRHVLWPTFD